MPDTASPSSPAAAVADAVHAVARRHGFSQDAVDHLWSALVRGDGRMAQFDHPEFGGAGQWMQGGMTMVSTMFEGRLQRRVAALCDDLAAVHRQAADATAAQDASGEARQGPAGAPGAREPGDAAASASRGDWWPAGLGRPASSGAQDGMRYAWFPESRRLVVESDGRRTVYDTGSHRIGGVSQQQGGVAGLAFASQHGTIDLAQLPVAHAGHPCATDAGPPQPATAPRAADDRPSDAAPPRDDRVPARGAVAPEAPGHPTPQRPRDAAGPARPAPSAAVAAPGPAAAHDPERVLALLEKLADLQARGILSAEEFAAKKTELLGRI
jgi:hypothetical protein